MRPFRCPLTILNTLDSLGKFDGKSDKGYLLGYFTSRNGPDWIFDLDFLTNTMNYMPVNIENQVTMDAVKDIVLDAKEKPSENAPKDNHVQDSEDVAEKEEHHNLTEVEQALKDDLENLVTQEMTAKAMDDATR
ncbi:hypothetical protein Tco_1047191 [Tanacetum coccineum]